MLTSVRVAKMWKLTQSDTRILKKECYTYRRYERWRMIGTIFILIGGILVGVGSGVKQDTIRASLISGGVILISATIHSGI